MSRTAGEGGWNIGRYCRGSLFVASGRPRPHFSQRWTLLSRVKERRGLLFETCYKETLKSLQTLYVWYNTPADHSGKLMKLDKNLLIDCLACAKKQSIEWCNCRIKDSRNNRKSIWSVGGISELQRINKSLIISREGLILRTMSIVTGLEGWIFWSWILYERMSVLHKIEGGIGKSLPGAWEISQGGQSLRKIWRVEGNLTLVEHIYIISSLSGKHGFKQNIHCNTLYDYIFLYSPWCRKNQFPRHQGVYEKYFLLVLDTPTLPQEGVYQVIPLCGEGILWCLHSLGRVFNTHTWMESIIGTQANMGAFWFWRNNI